MTRITCMVFFMPTQYGLHVIVIWVTLQFEDPVSNLANNYKFYIFFHKQHVQAVRAVCLLASPNHLAVPFSQSQFNHIPFELFYGHERLAVLGGLLRKPKRRYQWVKIKPKQQHLDKI